MTGFGEGHAADDRVRVSVSIRTVNHRYLDVSLRLPEVYRALELDVANRIKERLVRGRVEARFRVDPVAEPRFSVQVRRNLARRYREAAAELSEADPSAGPALSAAELLRLPEVVVVEPAEDEPGAGDQALLLEAIDGALDVVIATRRREGEHLRRVLGERIARLVELRGELENAAPAIKADLVEGLERRLRELLAEHEVDPARLAQEAAVLAERIDVGEELDRLAAHLEAFEALLDGDGSRGKRMDFLTQEILRELNTLGAKSRHSQQLARVVEAKELCEQLREQVQNIE